MACVNALGDGVAHCEHLGDDRVGVLLEVLDLRLERLGVRALDVGHPEADDAVGDALVLEPLDAVDVVGVVRDHVHLEVVPGVALRLADLGQPREQPVELLAVATGVHPAVALQHRSPQRGVHVTTDEQRHLLGRRGRLLHRGQLVELAVVAEELAAVQAAQDVDALVHPLAAPLPRHPQRDEVLRPRGQADAQSQPVVAQVGDRADLLGHQHGRPHGQLQHERREPQRARHRGEVGHQDQRLDELLVLEELAVAGVGVGVRRVGLPRVDQGVGDRHRGVAGGLRGLGQGGVVPGVRHGFGIGEPHRNRPLPRFPGWSNIERVPVFCHSGAMDLQELSDRMEIRELVTALHASRRHRRVGRASTRCSPRTPCSTTSSVGIRRPRTW